MLGFALGELALGEVKTSSNFIALRGLLAAMAKSHPSSTATTALSVIAKANTKLTSAPGYLLAAKLKSVATQRAVPGFVLSSILRTTVSHNALLIPTNVNPSAQRPLYWASNNTYWRGTGA